MKLLRYQYPNTHNNGAYEPALNGSNIAYSRLGSFLDDFFSLSDATYTLPSDLYEDDENYYVKVEIPGFSKEQINVHHENSVLSIQAASEASSNDSTASTQRKQELSLRLPRSVSGESITAKYEDGILLVTLPKSPESKPRNIVIE